MPAGNSSSIQTHIDYLKELNVSIYRCDIHVNTSGDLYNGENNDKLNTLLNNLPANIEYMPMIYISNSLNISSNIDFDYNTLLTELGSTPFSIPPSFPSYLTTLNSWNTYYNEALTIGQQFAIKHGLKIEYYNIGNETAFRIIKGTNLEENLSMLPNTEYFYQNTLYGGLNYLDYFHSEELAQKTIQTAAYIKGLIDGISMYDSESKFIVNGTRAHLGYYKLLKDIGVNFDIIGWNWYSEFGSLTSANSDNDYGFPAGFNMYNSLSSIFNKPIWLIETNKTIGSYNNREIEQADSIRNIMEEAYQLNNIKAVLVYELLDEKIDFIDNDSQLLYSDFEAYYGLVEPSDNTDWEYKPAFNTYRFSIEEFKYGFHDYMYSYYLKYANQDRDLIDDNGINFWAENFKDGNINISAFLESNIDVDSKYFVKETYRWLLEREGDETGINYHYNRILSGTSREEFISGMLASNEFWNKAQVKYDSPNEGLNFIDHLCRKLFPEIANCVLPENIDFTIKENRKNHANTLLNSTDYIEIFINQQYLRYFDRSVDQSGLEYHRDNWINQRNFIKKILSGDEFWRKSMIRGYCKRNQ